MDTLISILAISICLFILKFGIDDLIAKIIELINDKGDKNGRGND